MNSIALAPVRSSHLKAVGYDLRGGTLAIQFRDGEIYHYQGVGPSIHDQLMGASSKGKFFNSAIKRRYRSIPVGRR